MREKLFTLTRKQRDEMERRYRQTRERRVGDRLQAILLLDGGRSLSEVTEILRIHPKTIKRWIKGFAQHGIDELCRLQYDGSEADLSAEQITKLRAWLDEQIRSTKEAIA